MSDFLQFVDRIPTLPNRKKLTFENDGSVKYATVEYADEPIEEGTFLNKYNFNKLNAVLGYNEITAEYNETTNRVEFNTELSFNEFINNQIFNGRVINDYEIPTIGINTKIPMTAIGNGGYLSQFIKLSNGNIFIAGVNPSDNWRGYITIIDVNGNVIKSPTNIGGVFYYPQLIEMSNGNIMVAGHDDNNPNTYIAIFDENGNTIKSATNISGGNIIRNVQLIEMSGGNIMIVGSRSGSSYGFPGYVVILDNQGNTVGNVINVGRGFYKPQLMEMSNGNIIIIGYYSSSAIYGAILSQNGTIIKSYTAISSQTLSDPQMIEMSNGNIMIVGAEGSGSYRCYAIIVDKNLNIIKSDTLLNSNMLHPQLVEMTNANIMVVGASNSDNREGLVCIIDNNINVINRVNIGIYFWEPQIINLSDGNLAITGYHGYQNQYGELTILDVNGNILASIELGSYFETPHLIELNDKSILVIGNAETNNYPSYIYVGKPFLSINQPVLNDKPLNMYLKPNINYKFVYDEENNTFIIDTNIIPLFDITLEQAVNQIDLTGISDMLEDGKLYCIIISGGASSNSDINFGSNSFMYINADNLPPFALFRSYINALGTCVILGYTYTSSAKVDRINSTLTNYEYIKLSTGTFNSGTRIIIKEVC